MIATYEKEISWNKRYISYELCDVSDLERLLQAGENMIDIVIEDIECKNLQHLEGQYN